MLSLFLYRSKLILVLLTLWIIISPTVYQVDIVDLNASYFVLEAGEDPYKDYSLWINVCDIGETSCEWWSSGGATRVLTETYWSGQMTIYWENITEPTPVAGQYVTWYWDCYPSVGQYLYEIEDRVVLGKTFLPLVLKEG